VVLIGDKYCTCNNGHITLLHSQDEEKYIDISKYFNNCFGLKFILSKRIKLNDSTPSGTSPKEKGTKLDDLENLKDNEGKLTL